MLRIRHQFVLPVFLALVCLAAGAAAAGDGGAVKRFDLEIRNRRVQFEDDVIRVSKGDRVMLAWTADERVSLHLHGYDIEFEVRPGESSEHEFEAHATGRFPVTSHGFGGEHGGHHTLLYLEVHPE